MQAQSEGVLQMLRTVHGAYTEDEKPCTTVGNKNAHRVGAAVSNSPGAAPVSRRVRTRVERVSLCSCLMRSSSTQANFAADALATYTYAFNSFINPHLYQNHGEITKTRPLAQFPRRRDKISGGEFPARREGEHPDACSRQVHTNNEHPKRDQEHSPAEKTHMSSPSRRKQGKRARKRDGLLPPEDKSN